MIARDVMRLIFGVDADIWDGFKPSLPEDLQGWNSNHPIFKSIFQRTGPRVVIDVGVWKGASTIHMAELLQGDGIVIGIDSFIGTVDPKWSNMVPRKHGRCILYDQFISNIYHRGLQNRIVPLPALSAEAATLLNNLKIMADVIHIDAAHDYENVISDLRNYWDILKPGGFMIADDYASMWPEVIMAANEFAFETGLPIETSYPKWIIQKPANA